MSRRLVTVWALLLALVALIAALNLAERDADEDVPSEPFHPVMHLALQ